MNINLLEETVKQILEEGKGILAADESNSTAGKRLADIGQENTEENRRAMREMLFKTPEASKYISGVILYDETIRQADSEGKPFVQDMLENGVIAGIKVDGGLVSFEDSDVEKVTAGLETLAERLPEYRMLGAKFAKWRAVYTIAQDGSFPTQACVDEASQRLAKYAKICQENDIVPIVEPEVLMSDITADGTAYDNHSLARCKEVTAQALQGLFKALANQEVALSGILLKPNMVVAGAKSAQQGSVAEVSQATLEVLLENVPAEVGGVVFLSGGQSEELATEHLAEINRLAKASNNGTGAPWTLTFSYGRALQKSALQAWGGDNISAGQETFLERAKENSVASR